MDLQRTKLRISFGLGKRAAFYADMAAFMDAGIPPFKALERMIEVARRRWMTRDLADVYSSIVTAMKSGDSFAVSIAHWVPASEAVMLTGAEKAGADVLRSSFLELGQLLERQRKVRQQIVNSMLINGFIYVLIAVVVVVFMYSLVPQLSAAETPDAKARMSFAPLYFAFGNALMHYGIYFVLLVIAFVVWLVWSMPNWIGSWRESLDTRVPPYTLYQRTQATLFLSSASSMMRAGIPMKTVLTDMERFGSKWLRWHVRRMLHALNAGRQEVVAMDSGLLPRDTSDRLQIYSLVPDFTKIMSRLSADNFTAYEAAVKRFNLIVRVIAIICLVGFTLATLYAMFDFTNALQASVSAARHAASR